MDWWNFVWFGQILEALKLIVLIDVGDGCWRPNVSLTSHNATSKIGHQHRIMTYVVMCTMIFTADLNVTNMWKISPTYMFCHQHWVTNITMSPKSLSPFFGATWRSKNDFQNIKFCRLVKQDSSYKTGSLGLLFWLCLCNISYVHWHHTTSYYQIDIQIHTGKFILIRIMIVIYKFHFGSFILIVLLSIVSGSGSYGKKNSKIQIEIFIQKCKNLIGISKIHFLNMAIFLIFCMTWLNGSGYSEAPPVFLIGQFETVHDFIWWPISLHAW